MTRLALASGAAVPALGQGTWRMGESSQHRSAEVAALRLGVELGMTLIDTAEMYGEGGAEEVVGEAIAGQRERIFLVSKVYPHNAGRTAAIATCERSLRRLGTDCLDLYLLHWRGSTPLGETVEAFSKLVAAGKIRAFGVSNFDTDDMAEWTAIAGDHATATNQVMYNLARRGIEFDLLPWCRQRGIPVMAYSPLDQGSLRRNRTLEAIGSRIGATASQVALAWLLRQDGVMVIPKAVREEHVRENAAARELELSPGDLDELEAAFPPPRKKTSLAIV